MIVIVMSSSFKQAQTPLYTYISLSFLFLIFFFFFLTTDYYGVSSLSLKACNPCSFSPTSSYELAKVGRKTSLLIGGAQLAQWYQYNHRHEKLHHILMRPFACQRKSELQDCSDGCKMRKHSELKETGVLCSLENLRCNGGGGE